MNTRRYWQHLKTGQLAKSPIQPAGQWSEISKEEYDVIDAARGTVAYDPSAKLDDGKTVSVNPIIYVDTEKDALRARIAELEEAIEPFAHSNVNGMVAGDHPVAMLDERVSFIIETTLTVKDLRNAAAALANKGA